MAESPKIRVESYIQTPKGETRFDDLPPKEKRKAATALKQAYMSALFPNAQFRAAVTT